VLAGRGCKLTDADLAPSQLLSQPSSGAQPLSPVRDGGRPRLLRPGPDRSGGLGGVSSYPHVAPYSAALALSLVLQQGGSIRAVAAVAVAAN
jgi:hypothetical protein